MAHYSISARTLRFASFWSLFVLLTGWSAIVCSWCAKAVDALAVIYPGYSSTVIGGIIGSVWAFISLVAIVTIAKSIKDGIMQKAHAESTQKA